MDGRDSWEFYQRKGEGIRIAMQARSRANNYRDFKVGASVLYRRGRRFNWTDGSNWMPTKGGLKMCAEREALLDAYSSRGDEIIAIVVVGSYQPDDYSGKTSRTLHPCKGCRELIQTLRIDPDAIILTLRADWSRDDNIWSLGGYPFEQRTVRKLLEYHQSHPNGNGV